MRLQPSEQSYMEKVFLKFISETRQTCTGKANNSHKFSSRITFRSTYTSYSRVFVYLFLMHSTGEDDSLALKKKVTIDNVFGPDFQIHDPDAKWLSGE